MSLMRTWIRSGLIYWIPDYLLEELIKKNPDHFIDLISWRHIIGRDMKPILVPHPGRDEVELLPQIARIKHEEIGSLFGLDP